MNTKKLAIPDVLLLEYPVERDNRALFHNTYSRDRLRQSGIKDVFIEEFAYHVFRKNTVYGIHFQNHPKPQAKLISCTRGRILDVAVDLRKTSATYKQWVSVELNADMKRQLCIPHGFGHAALALEDDTCIVMRVDQCFDPLLSRSIQFNDPDLGILQDVSHPILSEQDRMAPRLADSDCNL